MDNFTPKKHGRASPEAKIQKSIKDMLTLKGWLVVRLPGDIKMSGMPDLFATHYRYGSRLVEVKLPGMKGSKFTPAQLEMFPKLCANGSGVWIMTGDSDSEYKKLFERFNWWKYLVK